MNNFQLTTTQMLERAEKYFSQKEVVSRTDLKVHRLNYKEVGQRCRSLSDSLEALGIKKGDRIGTLGWNHHRHLEAYFAVPNMNAVLHTINFRLPQEHLIYVINDAEDKVLLVDAQFIGLIEAIKDEIPSVQHVILMTDEENIPETSLPSVYLYESLIEQGDPTYQYPENIQENDPAGMCYTSATTGKPKGVVYTHRSTFLHSMTLGLAETTGVQEEDVSLPLVPMFHVNAWGFPYAATWFGTKQVLPGPNVTPQLILELIEQEKVTMSAGVPTIWLGVAQALEQGNYDTSSLKAVICGGSAAPKSLIALYEDRFNIPFIHAYGMTETSPVATLSRPLSKHKELSREEQLNIKATQGRVVPGLEVKVINEDGEVPADGETMGELTIRGPWITDQYYNAPDKTAESVKDGWLYTGDIATIDEDGFIQVVDRTKDLVKSGGEWISTVALENGLMAHEAVAEASVIGIPHEKWQERPLGVVVLKEGADVTKEELFEYIKPMFVKWWLPDDIVFVDEIPKTSVGKFLKRALRDQLSDYYLQEQ
ncbi:long-chain fatty acid--CoA ligase [Allobacillus halotolerans]|uniref:Long-chain fatty acid--CoA ligase n=1 Tax=Allobacillus halotolerans TaxID=570278 RepID=A0ABS6GNF1_9BACI|nr:long-chain fatty acid--CoA ligase [Allobacillus halotolerans]MBU6080180.1 long-chain fatty acid--CoA ligase [Allobacillus halotolerans]